MQKRVLLELEMDQEGVDDAEREENAWGQEGVVSIADEKSEAGLGAGA